MLFRSGVESHLISESGAFGLAFEAAQGDGGGVQLTGEGIDESRGASKKLGFGEAGKTGDAQREALGQVLAEGAFDFGAIEGLAVVEAFEE